MTTPQQAAARAEVAGRLSVYRLARASLHADIHRAAELGMTTTEIAHESGLTWHGVAKILRRGQVAPEPPPCGTSHGGFRCDLWTGHAGMHQAGVVVWDD